jgi:hypothetical protein
MNIGITDRFGFLLQDVKEPVIFRTGQSDEVSISMKGNTLEIAVESKKETRKADLPCCRRVH